MSSPATSSFRVISPVPLRFSPVDKAYLPVAAPKPNNNDGMGELVDSLGRFGFKPIQEKNDAQEDQAPKPLVPLFSADPEPAILKPKPQQGGRVFVKAKRQIGQQNFPQGFAKLALPPAAKSLVNQGASQPDGDRKSNGKRKFESPTPPPSALENVASIDSDANSNKKLKIFEKLGGPVSDPLKLAKLNNDFFTL